MIDATLEVCTEMCQGMFRDYCTEIDQAIARLPHDSGELSISKSAAAGE